MKWLVVLVILMSSRAYSAPCNVLLLDERPCEIEGGYPAPYSGTLMTKSTARSLADKVFEAKLLKIDLDTLKLVSQANYDTYEKTIVDLKIELEDAPRPLLEQPAFWIVAGAALVGGFVAGWVLSP